MVDIRIIDYGFRTPGVFFIRRNGRPRCTGNSKAVSGSSEIFTDSHSPGIARKNRFAMSVITRRRRMQSGRESDCRPRLNGKKHRLLLLRKKPTFMRMAYGA